jgi:hypothetical protein
VHYIVAVLTVTAYFGEEMKQKILDQEFNDKNFWAMFNPQDALEYFIPGYREYESQGIKFTIEDTSIEHKYLRHIEIWAEGDEKALFTMHLKGFNK